MRKCSADCQNQKDGKKLENQTGEARYASPENILFCCFNFVVFVWFLMVRCMMYSTVFMGRFMHSTVFGTAFFRFVRRTMIRTISSAAVVAAAMPMCQCRDCGSSCQHRCRCKQCDCLFPAFKNVHW